uniref:Sugar transporter SWEET n=1 Tax=Steinernema glaseri TaxID=37863 RepID=A0A1I7Z9C9_9BILA
MDLFTLFAYWLTLFSIGFTFLPVFQIIEWRARGTAEGFSSVNLVLPMLMMSCWLRHGFMTSDSTNILINTVNLVIFSFYILCFAYYQPKRQYLIGQVLSLIVSVYGIFSYVDQQPVDKANDVMGSIAAATQIIGLAGGLYEIKRAIGLGHTEYIPASLQFGIFLISIQWTAFGLIVGNHYIAIANFAGLAVNLFTIALYFVYPPLTWRVPIIGTGPQQKKKE